MQRLFIAYQIKFRFLVIHCLVDIFSLSHSQIDFISSPVSGNNPAGCSLLLREQKRKENIRCEHLGTLPPQDIGSISVMQTPIYFLCPTPPPILYIPIEFSFSTASDANLNISAETKSDISELLRLNTDHIGSFVHWSQPLEALSHYFLFGQLLSLVSSEKSQLFILSHLFLPMVL